MDDRFSYRPQATGLTALEMEQVNGFGIHEEVTNIPAGTILLVTTETFPEVEFEVHLGDDGLWSDALGNVISEPGEPLAVLTARTLGSR
jgi:hypothetical protein